MIKINDFWGDLSGISAKTATLYVTCLLLNPGCPKYLSQVLYMATESHIIYGSANPRHLFAVAAAKYFS